MQTFDQEELLNQKNQVIGEVSKPKESAGDTVRPRDRVQNLGKMSIRGMAVQSDEGLKNKGYKQNCSIGNRVGKL